MRIQVADAHQSGRFDASLAERHAMLAQIAKVALLGVVTEAEGMAMLPGWDCVGQETKVVWKRNQWRCLAHGTHSTPTVKWKRGTALRTSVEVTWSLMKHKTGVVALRGGGHVPAHLDVASQRRANQQALDGMHDALYPIIAHHQPDLTTLSFDFNRDLALKAQRALVQRAFTSLGLHLVVPPRPTEGPRTIDAFVTSSVKHDCTMLDRKPGFDHRGILLHEAG